MDRKAKGLMFNEDEERHDELLVRVMFVDPGLGGTGWAFWPELYTDGKGKKLTAPSQTGVLHAPNNEQWDNRVWSLCAAFDGTLTAISADLVVFEFPELFSGSATSHASASKGDLFKLTFLLGGLADRARARTGKLPVLVTPQEWKGQLPKEVVIQRIEKAYGERASEFTRDHEADAVGMGLAAQGRL